MNLEGDSTKLYITPCGVQSHLEAKKGVGTEYSSYHRGMNLHDMYSRNAYRHTYIHTYLPACTHEYIGTYDPIIYIYIYMYICTYIHMDIA